MVVAKINGINGFSSVTAYLRDKISRYEAVEKSFENFFSFMFSERDNIMAEVPDGYRVKKITYGQCADKIKAFAPAFASALSELPKGDMVGLYMANSVEWVETLWCILMCGYRPLLMNARMTDEMLEKILADYNISTVISDGKQFSVNTLIAQDIMNSGAEGDVDIL